MKTAKRIKFEVPTRKVTQDQTLRFCRAFVHLPLGNWVSNSNTDLQSHIIIADLRNLGHLIAQMAANGRANCRMNVNNWYRICQSQGPLVIWNRCSRVIYLLLAAGLFSSFDAIMKQIPEVEEKLLKSSLNMCPEDCCRKGWGTSPLTATLFSAFL